MEQVLTPTKTKKKLTPKKLTFFFAMGIVALIASVVGFATTFIIPVSTGTFKAPFVVYLHGAFAFGWVILFVIQTFLIYSKRHRLHIALGGFGLFLAMGTALTLLPVGKYSVQKELGNGLGDTAISTILGVITSAVVFLSLVIAGIVYKRKPQVHKRLMLLATIVVIWPAWFRFRHYFPSVPRPDIWFGFVLADSLIIIAWIRDKIALGKINPVLLYVGLLIIAEHLFEVLMFDSAGWRVIAKFIYGLM